MLCVGGEEPCTAVQRGRGCWWSCSTFPTALQQQVPAAPSYMAGSGRPASLLRVRGILVTSSQKQAVLERSVSPVALCARVRPPAELESWDILNNGQHGTAAVRMSPTVLIHQTPSPVALWINLVLCSIVLQTFCCRPASSAAITLNATARAVTGRMERDFSQGCVVIGQGGTALN